MRVAIFAEGYSDAAVLTNILKGSLALRTNVVHKINQWLDNNYIDNLAYAITIEETESWLLTLHENTTSETAKYNQPKNGFGNKFFLNFL